jgi:hypothetical protein
MTRKTRIAVGLLLVSVLTFPTAASAAKWSRGQCIDAVHQKLGVRASDAGRTTNKAAVARCLKYGPGAID